MRLRMRRLRIGRNTWLRLQVSQVDIRTRDFRIFQRFYGESAIPLVHFLFGKGIKFKLGDTPSSPVRKGCTLLYIPHEPTFRYTRKSFIQVGLAENRLGVYRTYNN